MRPSPTVLAVTAASVLMFVYPLPASADPSGESTVTITVEGGALELTVSAASRSLGTMRTTARGTTISGKLGQVTVTDKRNAPPGSGWVTSVVATDFTAKEGPAIPASKVSYTAGRIEGIGDATYSPNDPKNLKRAKAAVTATDITGNNTATWTPTVHVTVPPGLIPGVYASTITHSVM